MIRRGNPDRSLAGNRRSILFAERRRAAKAIGLRPAGAEVLRSPTQADARAALALGDASLADATDFAAASHNHDATYSQLSHNHTGVYSPVSHNHSGTYAPLAHTHNGDEVLLVADNWVGSLAGSSVKDCQTLADWIDANVVI